jgi:hypothetical protein
MFNFKTIATAAIIATTGLCVADVVKPQAADAAGSYCYVNNSSADVCILGVWRDGGNYKVVKSAVNGRVDVERVYCNPAHRYNYKQNMYGIACFEFS